MKRKGEPILKTTLEEELRKLKKAKTLEYRDLFREIVERDELYNFLSQEEQDMLVNKSSGLAMNVAGSVICTLRNNKYSDTSLKYLEDIQRSDGSLPVSLYGNLIKRGIISEDGLSICLLGIVSNNYEDQKSALSFFRTISGDFEEKPYKDNYLKFCVETTKAVMGEALEIARQKLKEDKEHKAATKKTVSWAKSTTSRTSNDETSEHVTVY